MKVWYLHGIIHIPSERIFLENRMVELKVIKYIFNNKMQPN